MTETYAKEFNQILSTLKENNLLRESVINLIDKQPIAGKITEGLNRLSDFKEILKQYVNGEYNQQEVYQEVENKLPRASSSYASDNRVFANGWSERLVRTQLSRFYNQAVMEHLISNDESQCFIPHSSEEERTSKCSIDLAGKVHDVKRLYDLLIGSYANGNWSNDLKIPHHPHCTHVVCPVE